MKDSTTFKVTVGLLTVALVVISGLAVKTALDIHKIKKSNTQTS